MGIKPLFIFIFVFALDLTAAPTSTSVSLVEYCQKYLVGLMPDIISYSNYLKLYRASVEITAKGHTNAEQPPLENGQTTFTSYPNDDQKYGDDRYTVHLIDVESVLRRFGFLPRASVRARRLRLAARFHDTDEDTPIKKAQIEIWLGSELARLIDAVTKVKPIEGVDAQTLKRMTIEKVLTHPDGVILKLADRIANVEKGLRTNGILPKYISDYALFRKILYKPGQADEMWDYLDILISTQAFPRGKSYWAQRLRELKYRSLPSFEGQKYKNEDLRKAKVSLPEISTLNESLESVDIRSIHFMQHYADEYLSHKKYSVIETAHDLRNWQITVKDLPPIDVWRDATGKIWTLDHRRLAAYRLSGMVLTVPVNWVNVEKVKEDAFKFEPFHGGKTIQILLDDGTVILPD